ncbi:MAG: hypothetical protein M3Z21_15525, partial [Pseudomonadota bacterium]|nr:hypothetical protein [Pseudomonadota bacterium]
MNIPSLCEICQERRIDLTVLLLTLSCLPRAQAQVPLDCTYLGGTSNWSNAGAWNGGDCMREFFPNNAVFGEFTEIFNATVDSGTVSLDIPITIQAFNLTGGTVDGPGDLTLNDVFTWTGGTLGGTGTTTALGGMEINGTVAKVLGADSGDTRTLINAGGTANWSEGNIFLNAAGVRLLNDGGVFNVTGTTRSIDGSVGGTGTFDNTGTLNVNLTDSGNVLLVFAPFNNSGVVDVQTGELFLGGSGTHSGDFMVAAGQRLVFNGTYTLQSGAAVSGGGEVEFAGGTTTFETGSSYSAGST